MVFGSKATESVPYRSSTASRAHWSNFHQLEKGLGMVKAHLRSRASPRCIKLKPSSTLARLEPVARREVLVLHVIYREGAVGSQVIHEQFFQKEGSLIQRHEMARNHGQVYKADTRRGLRQVLEFTGRNFIAGEEHQDRPD